MDHIHVIVQRRDDGFVVLVVVDLCVVVCEKGADGLFLVVDDSFQLPAAVGVVPPEHGIGRKEELEGCFRMCLNL